MKRVATLHCFGEHKKRLLPCWTVVFLTFSLKLAE